AVPRRAAARGAAGDRRRSGCARVRVLAVPPARGAGDSGTRGGQVKISIDYDGTMWSHMAFFREFMRVMQAAGHQVGILTAHSERMRDGDIDLMTQRGFPPPSFWLGRSG